MNALEHVTTLRWQLRQHLTATIAAVAILCAAQGKDIIDLRRIDHLAPKGRAQDEDYNGKEPVVKSLLAQGTNAIPILVALLSNDTLMDHPIVDYWPPITVGDAAFILLTDLTTDSSWRKPTIPKASWDDVLGTTPSTNLLIPRYNQLQDFKKKNGSKAIQRRWQKIWSDHRHQIYWDSNERCFKLAGQRQQADDFPIARLQYPDRSRAYHLHSPYGFLLTWEKGTGQYYEYDKPLRRITTTTNLDLFISSLKALPDAAEVAWINPCAAPFHYGMPANQLSQVKQVLQQKRFRMAGTDENNFPLCTCEATNLVLFTQAP